MTWQVEDFEDIIEQRSWIKLDSNCTPNSSKPYIDLNWIQMKSIHLSKILNV